MSMNTIKRIESLRNVHLLHLFPVDRIQSKELKGPSAPTPLRYRLLLNPEYNQKNWKLVVGGCAVVVPPPPEYNQKNWKLCTLSSLRTLMAEYSEYNQKNWKHQLAYEVNSNHVRWISMNTIKRIESSHTLTTHTLRWICEYNQKNWKYG